MNPHGIVRSITLGYMDAHLEAIFDAVADREAAIANGAQPVSGTLASRGTVEEVPIGRPFQNFHRGCTVKVTSANLRPRYLFGREFIVKKVNDKTVVVDFPDDPTFRRFSGLTDVRVPKDSVEVV